jgi:hypothetical protein
MKKYFHLFDFSQSVNYKTEILSGLIVFAWDNAKRIRARKHVDANAM